MNNIEQLKELLIEVNNIVNMNSSLYIQIINGCIIIDEYVKEDRKKHLYYSPLFHGWNDEDDDED